jgi:hypothetical protein
MIKWWGVFVILLSVSFDNAVAGTQTSTSEKEDDTICLPTLRGWHGKTEDIRQIQQIPVPESYRTGVGGGCGGPIMADFLIAWHLRYGSEDTVQQAMAFIEKRDGAFDALFRRLDKDLSDALAKLNKEFEVEAKRKDSRLNASQPDKFQSFITKSDAADKLSLIKHTLDRNVLDRANLYLNAAEILQSKRLAARAREVFTLYEVIETRLLPKRTDGSSATGPFVSMALEYVEKSSNSGWLTSMEVELRLTVLEALLNPSAETAANAAEVLERHYQAAYAFAPEVVFSGGGEFCDLQEEHFSYDHEFEIAKACKNSHEFFNKVMAYGYADAMLAIVTGDNQRMVGWDWQEYTAVTQKDMVDNSGQRRSLFGYNDDYFRVINLKLALADKHFANSKAKVKGDGRWSYEEAWRLLSELSSLANPAKDPVRFRQIAERAIAVNAEMEKENEGWRTHNAPLLAYYRLNLQNLEKLTYGEIP